MFIEEVTGGGGSWGKIEANGESQLNCPWNHDLMMRSYQIKKEVIFLSIFISIIVCDELT